MPELTTNYSTNLQTFVLDGLHMKDELHKVKSRVSSYAVSLEELILFPIFPNC